MNEIKTQIRERPLSEPLTYLGDRIMVLLVSNSGRNGTRVLVVPQYPAVRPKNPAQFTMRGRKRHRPSAQNPEAESVLRGIRYRAADAVAVCRNKKVPVCEQFTVE